MRKLGTDESRLIVAPWPSIVIALVTTGSPLSPLSGDVSVYVQPSARLRVSAPGELLAVLTAATSAVLEHDTGIVAACAVPPTTAPATTAAQIRSVLGLSLSISPPWS